MSSLIRNMRSHIFYCDNINVHYHDPSRNHTKDSVVNEGVIVTIDTLKVLILHLQQDFITFSKR